MRKPIIHVNPANNYSKGLKITNENGRIITVTGTGGGNVEGSGNIGVGFGIDTEDNLWKTSKQIIITINKPSVQLVVNQKIAVN